MIFMGNVFFFDWEIQFMAWLQSFESDFLTAVATGFTMMGEEYLMILIIGLVYWSLDKNLGRKISLALSGTMVCGAFFKCLAMRRRPYMDNPEIQCIRAAHPDEELMSVTAQGYSFPSLHAAMSAATYGSLARETGKKLLGYLAFILPLFIGLSRNYLGVHYPTDVIGGWIIGAVVVFGIGAIEHRKGYMPAFAVILAIGAVGIFFAHDNEYFSCIGTALGLATGFKFEEKRVHFEKATTPRSIILRPIGGVLLFAVLSALLKLPVASLPKAGYETFLLAYRAFRYAVTGFAIMGLYPLLFRKVRFLG